MWGYFVFARYTVCDFFVYPILGKTLAQYWGTFSSLLLNFALVFVWIESASLFRRLQGQIWLSLAPQPESPDDQT